MTTEDTQQEMVSIPAVELMAIAHELKQRGETIARMRYLLKRRAYANVAIRRLLTRGPSNNRWRQAIRSALKGVSAKEDAELLDDH